MFGWKQEPIYTVNPRPAHLKAHAGVKEAFHPLHNVLIFPLSDRNRLENQFSTTCHKHLPTCASFKNVCSIRFPVPTLCPESSTFRFSANKSISLRIQQEAARLSTLSSEKSSQERSQMHMNAS